MDLASCFFLVLHTYPGPTFLESIAPLRATTCASTRSWFWFSVPSFLALADFPSFLWVQLCFLKMFPFIWHGESFVEGELLSCLSLSSSLHSWCQNHSVLFCSTNLLRSHNVPETVLVLIISVLPFCTLTCPHMHTHVSTCTHTQPRSQSSNIKSQEVRKTEGRRERILPSIASLKLTTTQPSP